MNGVTAIRSEFRPKETLDGLECKVRMLERSVLRGSIMQELTAEANRTMQLTEILIFDHASAGHL
jgi:hypothetical protein